MFLNALHMAVFVKGGRRESIRCLNSEFWTRFPSPASDSAGGPWGMSFLSATLKLQAPGVKGWWDGNMFVIDGR